MKAHVLTAALLLAATVGLASLYGQIAPATTSSATHPAAAPWGPAELPGRGLAQHPFMYAGEAAPLNIFIIRDGKVAWSYTHPRPQRGAGEISDATMLSNGSVLFAFQYGAALVNPDKKGVWSVDAEPACEIHTAQPLGTDRVMYVQNGNPAKLKVVDIVKGTTDKEFTLPTRFPTPNAGQVHMQFRRARVTAAGTFLVSHMDLGRVSEYDPDGKEIWKVAIQSPWSAVRLKDGNTLIASNNNFVREVNPAGQTVWEFRPADAPDIRLFNTQTAIRLANGNTLINNWRTPQGGNYPVQFFEVTPDKKVVWAVRSWADPNLGASTNIQLLDEPGIAEKGELQR